MTLALFGWLQSQEALPSIEMVRGWLSTTGIFGFGIWLSLRSVSHGELLAFIKGNSATKEGLSSAVDKIRNDVTAANLEHRIAVADELSAIKALAERRSKPR